MYTGLVQFPTPSNKALAIPRSKGTAYGEYTLWRTAPTLCGGAGEVEIVLLGETAKFISMSRQRIASLAVSCGPVSSSLSIGCDALC